MQQMYNAMLGLHDAEDQSHDFIMHASMQSCSLPAELQSQSSFSDFQVYDYFIVKGILQSLTENIGNPL